MTQKFVTISLADYAYTVDNRLASITNGTTTWLFSYDGDGNRVALLVTNGTSAIQTSYYAGGAYEVTNDGTTTTTKKYYAIAGQTVAMDDGSGLKYLLTDHLGSTVGVTDAAGELDEWSSVTCRSVKKEVFWR